MARLTTFRLTPLPLRFAKRISQDKIANSHNFVQFGTDVKSGLVSTLSLSLRFAKEFSQYLSLVGTVTELRPHPSQLFVGSHRRMGTRARGSAHGDREGIWGLGGAHEAMEQEAVTGNVRVSWVSARAAAGDEAWELYGGWCAHTYGLAICACGNRLRAGVHTGCMVAHVIGACCEWAGCPRKGWTVRTVDGGPGCGGERVRKRRPQAVSLIEMGPHLEIRVAELQPLNFATPFVFLVSNFRLPSGGNSIRALDLWVF
ncbi:hypothetical protein FIBSPDRAFT_899318 [Athelia psychrophila]|uniref:Uncharacterized protein n=1 Tax=Athelia psychrophila TaxID=1759441 RepID=A0A165ZVV9_9AGAM|nr:hypothetical protein FIBSPDRAFT_899318 [Fibularhizoctonia sp. CBS 109695]